MNSLKKLSLTSLTPGTAREPLGERDRGRVVEPREPRQPGFAEQRQMDREGERAQTGIRADVAGRLLAADVLLAGRQGQHPAAPAVGIDGLADEPARHLPHVFLAAWRTDRHGAAEIERIAERLALGRDDVGAHLARRRDRPERQDLGDDDDEQRALLMADLASGE